MGYFFKAMQIAGVVMNWSSKALQDGKITLTEACDLATQIAAVLGVTVELDLPE